jgi:hypothetical protein
VSQLFFISARNILQRYDFIRLEDTNFDCIFLQTSLWESAAQSKCQGANEGRPSLLTPGLQKAKRGNKEGQSKGGEKQGSDLSGGDLGAIGMYWGLLLLIPCISHAHTAFLRKPG